MGKVNKDGIKKPERTKSVVRVDPKFVKLTTGQIIKTWLIDKLLLGNDVAQKIHELEHERISKDQLKNPAFNPTPREVKAYHLAVVVDNDVLEIMRTSDGMTDILLKRPEFIMYSPAEVDVRVGMSYIDGEFKDFEAE